MSITNLDVLRSIPLFETLGDDELRTLARELSEGHFSAGQYVFSTNGAGDKMYIIERGRVELFLQDQADHPVAGAGDSFGELSFLGGSSRAASARALEDTDVIAIDQHALEALVTAHPASALAMMSALSRSLGGANRMAQVRTLRSRNYEIAASATWLEKVSDFAVGVMGDIRFVGCYGLWILVWIVLNSNVIPGMAAFDPFPFPLLTLIMVIEIALLALFVLVSQSRQTDREKIYNDIEYDAALRAEADIRALTQQLEEFQRATMTNFSLLERRLDRRA